MWPGFDSDGAMLRNVHVLKRWSLSSFGLDPSGVVGDIPKRPMKISLFIPCYVDQLRPDIGFAVVEVFEKLGHTIEVPASQTCCGQPALNSGYEPEAREVARHFLRTFEGCEKIVTPSGSCAAMVDAIEYSLGGILRSMSRKSCVATPSTGKSFTTSITSRPYV